MTIASVTDDTDPLPPHIRFSSSIGDTSGVHPQVWFYVGIIADRHFLITGFPLVLTGLRRKAGNRPSRHSPVDSGGKLVTAFDFRRWYLDNLSEEAAATVAFCRDIQRDFGGQLGVVLEPEWLSPEQIEQRGGIENISPHVHMQLKGMLWLPADPNWSPILPQRIIS